MKKKREIIYLVLLAVFTALYLVWRIGWTIPTDHRPIDMVFALILLAAELVGFFDMAIHFGNSFNISEPKAPKIPEQYFPDVDVLIPNCGEPVELLRQTVSACLAMQYPAGRLHVFLCDDKNRPEIKALADEVGAKYLARKEHNNAKAGNLNYALERCSSPLVAVFDADMCPKPEFLQKTVPFFIGTPGKKGFGLITDKIGFVQTPQSFRTTDLFQSAFVAKDIIPNEQDYFYLNLEIARNKTNSVIFGGSNTLLSRFALNKSGGFLTGSITEDFATGIAMQQAGFTCYAISEPLATGLCPETLSGLIRQRRRWARGCIQAGRITRYMKISYLNLRQKLNILSAIGSWYSPLKRLIYLIAPMLYPLFGITVMRCNFLQMAAFWLPMYILTVVGIRLFSGNIRSCKWTEIYELIQAPFLIIPVLAETFGIHQRQFHVTDKSGTRHEHNGRYAIPFVVLIILSLYSIVITIAQLLSQQTTAYLFLLFWLLYNCYELLYALTFVLRCGKITLSTSESGFAHALRQGYRAGLINIWCRIPRDNYIRIHEEEKTYEIAQDHP